MKALNTIKLQKILTVYDHYCSMAERELAIQKLALQKINQKVIENTQAINSLKNKFKKAQSKLLTSQQLSNWQSYRYYSTAQHETARQLRSKKSRLEMQSAVSQNDVNITLQRIHELNHKRKVFSKLKKQAQLQSLILTNEIEDESSTQQWQLADKADDS